MGCWLCPLPQSPGEKPTVLTCLMWLVGQREAICGGQSGVPLQKPYFADPHGCPASSTCLNVKRFSCRKRGLGAVQATQKTLRITESRAVCSQELWTSSAVLSLTGRVPEIISCFLGSGVSV